MFVRCPRNAPSALRLRRGVRCGVLCVLSACLVLVGMAGAQTPGLAKNRRQRGNVGRAKPTTTDRVLVPAGPFVMGSNKGALDERPVRNVRLPAFAIDRTEVTRRMYAACVLAGRCAALPGLGDPSLPLPDAQAVAALQDPDVPVTQVNWHEARAFCAFAGGRLPQEKQWEKAARGPEGRVFPWGDALLCEKANWGNFAGEGPCAAENPGRPLPVGQRTQGASVYGAHDLAGNVWEWVQDIYPDTPGRRVVKGGSCCSYFVPPRAPNRNGWDPDHRDADLGFRCVGKVVRK